MKFTIYMFAFFSCVSLMVEAQSIRLQIKYTVMQVSEKGFITSTSLKNKKTARNNNLEGSSMERIQLSDAEGKASVGNYINTGNS